MNAAEQIAYLRKSATWVGPEGDQYDTTVRAVCDLAERALLTDDETEAVREWLNMSLDDLAINAVLRRLLPEERGDVI